MAGSVNKVILIGNLGADPEIRRQVELLLAHPFPSVAEDSSGVASLSDDVWPFSCISR